MNALRSVVCSLVLVACGTTPKERTATAPVSEAAPPRTRARDLGIHIGRLPSGGHDAITDVAGVRVGHATVHEGDRLHTGVTVVLPPGDNPFVQKLPAAVVVLNGFGKLMGSTQLDELGQLESPIALTSTLNVARVADGLLDWLLALPGNEAVRSANVVVGETNDGGLSDIRARAVTASHVQQALATASGGPVEVGAVGAGAGTICFGWKGGIGTSSRQVRGHTVGVLVQANFGGALRVDGRRVDADQRQHSADHDGSCMIVVATDAPLDAASLRRLAVRAFAGMARTGASFSHGSGDYTIAFSTKRDGERLAGDALSPLFVAVADATEQAILDALCAATTTTGQGRTVRALPYQLVAPSGAR
jgi:D-aminopeptidase